MCRSKNCRLIAPAEKYAQAKNKGLLRLQKSNMQICRSKKSILDWKYAEAQNIFWIGIMLGTSQKKYQQKIKNKQADLFNFQAEKRHNLLVFFGIYKFEPKFEGVKTRSSQKSSVIIAFR
jgi:hypothetical protein